METPFMFQYDWRSGRTDPTYKEWKLIIELFSVVAVVVHGSYLQGMETTIA